MLNGYHGGSDIYNMLTFVASIDIGELTIVFDRSLS